jgi:UDP-2,3-diacylglucosamine pyrophosphatase LpxH/biotin operon repressor
MPADRATKILAFIEANPGATLNEVCRGTHMRDRIAKEVLEELELNGRAENRSEVGNKSAWFLASPTLLSRHTYLAYDPTKVEPIEDIEVLTKMRRLVELTHGHPKTLEELCDELDMSPKAAKALISQARSKGYDVEVSEHVVGRAPEPTARAPKVIAQPSKDWQLVGVISDTHLGSKYCLREQIKDFIHEAYRVGVREILHPGDVLDGCYEHGRWEVTHPGIDDQADDLFETLPKLEGLTYHCIEGNHDEVFRSKAGIDVGRYLQARFEGRGRNDLKFYGSRGAMLKVRGALFELWHPRGSGSYAKSYRGQKFVANSFGPYKPDIVLIGHFHSFNYCVERGIHVLQCPTFQGSGSSFSKSLGGSPSIGGMVLSWRLTSDGTLRDFNLSLRSYYEREAPRELQAMKEYPVAPANYTPFAVQGSK